MYKVSDPEAVKYTVAAEANENTDGFMVVGHYAIIKELGRGSYGTVYQVKHNRTGEEYAMKEYHKATLRKRQQAEIMKRTRGQGPMQRGRGRGGGLMAMRQAIQAQQSAEADDPFSLIRMELAIWKKLKHPNLVRLYEVLNDQEQDVLYLVMDLCKNGTVQNVNTESTNTDPLDPEKARKYFTQAMLALEYLHENDIVHRDLKPDNMLINSEDVLKITDFGESMLLGNQSDKIKGYTGTPAFMAPELCKIKTEISGQAADIWSLGVCLYSFVYGRLPFVGSTILEVYDAVSDGNLEFPEPGSSSIDGSDDKSVKDLIVHMLDPDPETRITIDDIRVHPWITKNDTIELPSKTTNCQNAVLQITQEDLDNTIQPIYDIMPVIIAVAKLKRFRKRIKEKRERKQQEEQR